jgi:hypothetical protein
MCVLVYACISDICLAATELAHGIGDDVASVVEWLRAVLRGDSVRTAGATTHSDAVRVRETVRASIDAALRADTHTSGDDTRTARNDSVHPASAVDVCARTTSGE